MVMTFAGSCPEGCWGQWPRSQMLGLKGQELETKTHFEKVHVRQAVILLHGI